MARKKIPGKNLNIVLIGSSNVATQLGNALQQTGYNIIQVYSKTKKNAEKLAHQLHCSFTNNIKQLVTDADIYLIAVNDDQIKTVAAQLKLKDKLVLHTAGSIDLSVLTKTSENCGILYPLQTLQKNKSYDFNTIPVLIEASNARSLKLIREMANSISEKVVLINSDQRKKIHLTAVMVSNFSNHLYDLSQEFLKKEKISFDLLLPLIEKTVENLQLQDAHKNQTGPARRGDKKVIAAHLQLLNNEPQLRKIYRLMSDSILQHYAGESKKS